MREPDNLILGGANAYGVALNWLGVNVKGDVKQRWDKCFFEAYEKLWDKRDKISLAFHAACEKTGIDIPLYNNGDYV